MKSLKFALLALVLVSFNAYPYCSYDDAACAERASRADANRQSQLAEQESQFRREMEEARWDMERDREAWEREEQYFNQPTRYGAQDIICDYLDTDC